MNLMHVRHKMHVIWWLGLAFGCNGNLRAKPTVDTIEDSKFIARQIDLTENTIKVVPSPHHLNELLSSPSSKTWTLVMNAGMFEPDYGPVGLQIIDGRETSPLNLKDGNGNFYLKPNGVFAITTTYKAMILDSIEVPSDRRKWEFATQSGPLLLKDGVLHSALNPTSKNKHIRNGVCIQSPTNVVFILSSVPVQFYELATYMKNTLQCTDGLYLDGAISVLYERESENSWHPTPIPTTLGSWLVVEPIQLNQ